MKGASAEYVIITEPSREAPRLTMMLVQESSSSSLASVASCDPSDASCARHTRWRGKPGIMRPILPRAAAN